MTQSPDTPRPADPVAQATEAITTIHARSERKVDRHQRAVETVTGLLGRPGFLYGVMAGVAIWVGSNLIARHLGLPVWDTPPFYWLQGLLGLSALLTTVVVLITQNRMGKTAERRAQLDLQMNLLVEQKVTKLIELIEELRRDLPSVKDRSDPLAEAMAESADPHAMLMALEVTLDHGSTIDELTTAQTESEQAPASPA